MKPMVIKKEAQLVYKKNGNIIIIYRYYFVAFRIMMGAFLLAHSGCVFTTSGYYMPLVAQRFPPKPAEVIIPILEDTPKRPHLVIGKFAFETENKLNFIYKSLQYNARKNGADAIIMRSLTSRRREWMENHGPSIESKESWVKTHTQTRLITNSDGTTRVAVVHYPVFYPGYTTYHPGYTTQREQTLTSVQAEMIVYR